jgi:purine nucleosidase
VAKHRVILDCDPGVDDAFALMLAFAAADYIDLLGITCVAGNVSLAHTERNTRRLCTLAGKTDISVFAGCPRPIMWAVGEETHVHGVDGLGDVAAMPEPAFELQSKHAVNFIIDTIMKEPSGTVTLCVIGPMTNIALAIVMQPAIVPRIKELVFMGGAAFSVSAVRIADLNFYCDPHAAQIVVSSGIPQTMFGIDATEKTHVTPAHLAKMEALPGRIPKLLVEMFKAYAKGDPRLHDVCTIAHLIDPTLFQGVQGHIAVEHGSTHTRGITVARVHPRKIKGFEANTLIINEVDTERLFDLLLERLATLEK